MAIDVSNLEYKFKSKEGIGTGFKSIDSYLDGLVNGEISIVFGRSGEGKSTFVNQIIANCIYNNKKVYLYNGELSKFKLQDWIYRPILGSNPNFYYEEKTQFKTHKVIKPEIVKSLKRWHKGRFFTDGNNDKVEKDISEILKPKNVTDFYKNLYKDMMTIKPDITIIDNLMTAIDENAGSVYADQGTFIQTAKDIAVNLNTHVLIVAHTNKNKDECDDEKSSFNLVKKDLNGSGNITNKTDVLIGICRNWYKTKLIESILSKANNFDPQIVDGLPDLWVGLLKDREEGSRKIIEMGYSKEAYRIYDQFSNKYTNEQYEFLNYLDNGYKKQDYFLR